MKDIKERYVDLVHAYVRDELEADLAAIGDLRNSLIENETPIEELVGMHERAMLTLGDSISSGNFAEIVTKTSACFSELAIAYSLADLRKKTLLDREQRIDRERQRLESLGQIAGGVAHEFNNLLQPILGMAEMALEDAEPGCELAEQLAVILDCAHKAAAIAATVLATARKQGPEPGPARLAPLLRKSVQFLSAVLPHEIKLDLSMDCDDEIVMCEAGELSQVLLNLVRNAGDAMGGKGTVRITLQNHQQQSVNIASGRVEVVRCLALLVADHGVGMPAEIATRALQPFFTTKSPSAGTGLGLSIVLSIVQGWNGTLELDSVSGVGTCVTILLPIVASQPRPVIVAPMEDGST